LLRRIAQVRDKDSNFEQAGGACRSHLPVNGGACRPVQRTLTELNDRRRAMKKLIIAAAFATLLASPAFAQAYNPNVGSGNVVPPPAGFASTTGYGAFAYAPARSEHLRGVHAQAMARDAVEQDGQTIGQDPDPNVRLQLRRDAPWTYE
jgi:hypothetical protein